ncbi:hypothetical protein KSF78_0002694 [Schistosoma japonicum]|nr:hypothetical protein KSF78_0002694 [Schistosoma japonicum]
MESTSVMFIFFVNSSEDDCLLMIQMCSNSAATHVSGICNSPQLHDFWGREMPQSLVSDYDSQRDLIYEKFI